MSKVCECIKGKRPPKHKAPHGKTQKGTPHHETHARAPAGAKRPQGMPVHAGRVSRRKHFKVLPRSCACRRANNRHEHHAAAQSPNHGMLSMVSMPWAAPTERSMV